MMQGGSPKSLKTSFFQQNQRIPFQMIPQRDHDKSPSPQQQTSSPSDQIRNQNRKIALNKIAFAPGKGSPQQQNQPINQQQSPTNKLEKFANCDTSILLNKQSPNRKSSNDKAKVVFSLNQIKGLRKDQSPSPDNSNVANFKLGKNVIGAGQCEANQHSRASFKSKQVQQRNSKMNLSILSDDETNVQSDNEENKQQNFGNILKKQENSTNYNKPKLGGNNECQDKKSPDQRIKVISKKKIMQSPSPPPQQNILLRVKLSPNQNQPQQLATDLIKGLITQTKQQEKVINSPQQTQYKAQQQPLKKLGLPKTLKLAKTPNQGSPTNQQQFQSEMQKHGFMKDIKEFSELNLKLLDSKMPIQEAPSASQRSNLMIKSERQRDFSPPPSQQILQNQSSSTNIHRISTKEESAKKQKQQVELNENSPQGNEQVFQFPFQRRARSFSPKQDEEKENQQKSKSPSPVGNDEQRNKPVIAKTNFVIAHKGVLGKGVIKEEHTFERSKEVDEWLMGSGESAMTAGSTYSNNHVKKQQELEKPIQPAKCEGVETEGDDEDWMFKTFDPFKQKNQSAQKQNNKKSGLIGDMRGKGGFEILDEDKPEQVVEESPFDLAPEMNKQFQKQVRGQKQFIGEEVVPVCDDLNSYIGQLDDLIEKNFRM